MVGISRRWLSAVLVFIAAAAACVAPVDEAGRGCPCSSGWQCCHDVCITAASQCEPQAMANPRYASMPARSALDLGPFRCESVPGEASNECLSLTNDAALRYDSVNHRIWLLGKGNSADDSLYSFDPDTAQWSRAYAPTACTARVAANYEPDAGAWVTLEPIAPIRPIATAPKDRLVFVPSLSELILLGRGPAFSNSCSSFAVDSDQGRVAHWSPSQRAWAFSSTALVDAQPDVPTVNSSWELDPASQLVVGVSEAGLHVYDPTTRTKRHVFGDFGVGELGYSNELISVPDGGFFYFERTSAKVFHLDFDAVTPLHSRLAAVVTSGTYPAHDEPGYAWNPRTQRIGGAVKDNRFFTFDPATATFSSSVIHTGDGGVAQVGTMQSHCMTYDDLNDVFYFLTTAADGYHLWAYRD